MQHGGRRRAPSTSLTANQAVAAPGFRVGGGEWAGTEAGSGGIQLIRSCLIGLALGHATYTVDYCTAGGSVAPVGVGVE